jgi:hypothetical protein
MKTEDSEAPSLIYELGFGAVFKLKHEDKRITAVSRRDRDKRYWQDAQEIEDHGNVYDDLGADQFAIVHIESKGDVVRIRDLFRASLLADSDTGTIQQAVHRKILGQILEQALEDWLKASGPILVHETGEPSIISPDDLTARYDYKDIPALRVAYECQLREDSLPEHAEGIAKAAEKFAAFLAQAEPEDEIYWFEHNAMMADRIGYAILRQGRAVAVHIVIMS